jgi:hypothetical protein
MTRLSRGFRGGGPIPGSKLAKVAAVLLPLFVGAAGCAKGAPVTGTSIDESDLVLIKNGTHPAIRSVPSIGRTDHSLRMERMILSLQIAPEKRRSSTSFWTSSRTRRRPSTTSG